MIKIITTNSYFNFFNILTSELENEPRGIDEKNFVFCEEKISLMSERAIATKFGGSFNTAVYSFGNYYSVNKRLNKTLSKEGASMVVRKILQSLSLKTFKGLGQNLAPTLFELIIQLKSASVKPSDLEIALGGVKGILKNKITDILAVYSAYEKYLLDNGLTDQSAQLDCLPEIICNDKDIKGATVFVVGFQGFTAQIKNAIISLIKTAKNVTFILPDGDNKFAFVGETKKAVLSLCERLGVKYELEVCNAEYEREGQYVVDNLFAPRKKGAEKVSTEKIFTYGASTPNEQARKVAGVIRDLVINKGVRYNEITLACVDSGVKSAIKEEFIKNEIPFSLDDRKSAEHHPLIRLIISYVDIFRKNKERRVMLDFIKNPLVSPDKEFNDKFENYVYKYNVNYSLFDKPFVFDADKEEVKLFEDFRQKINALLKKFNPENLLEELSAEDRLKEYTKRLKGLNAVETSAVNEQIYKYVLHVLAQMKEIFGEVVGNYNEFREIFLSGVSALKISILPQFSDAVFVGDFKECAMAKADYLFLVGLDESVPNTQGDVALLSDADISALENVSLLIEPKIKIVNHRAREQTLLGVACFNKALYVTYKTSSSVSSKASQCEVVNFLLENFTTKVIQEKGEYLSLKSGLRDFAIRCSEFVYGDAPEMGDASCFYELNKEVCEKIVNYSNKEVVIRLDKNNNVLVSQVASPTAIESYYACPYKFFVSRVLRVKEREEGVTNALDVGNVMHEIFNEVISKIDDVNNESEILDLINQTKSAIVSNPAYSRLLLDPKSNYELNEAINESYLHLKKMYKLHKNSLFKSGGGGTEVVFGKAGDYPEIPLLSGKVNLSGKIDRVDTYGDYVRVIDYKTGTIGEDESGLFSGTKLQLYLYGLAIKGKKLAGAYYMPIKNEFGEKHASLLVGKSLNEQELLKAQDKTLFEETADIPTLDAKNFTTEEGLKALMEYSRVICEKGLTLMEEGFIFPSPYDKTCDYCEYRAFCSNREGKARKLNVIREKDVVSALELEAKDE